MGQILSSSKSGNETTPQWKSVNTYSTSKSSYETEWKIRQQEVERLYQAKKAREAREAREQEAERLRQARQAREAREQEAEKLKKARQAREQEAEKLKQARQAREREAIILYLAAKRREKASQITKNTSALSNGLTSSERKSTSGTKDNTTHVPYRVGLKMTSGVTSGVTPGAKVNTISLSHSPSVEKKKTTPSGVKGNPTSSDPYNISLNPETSLSKEDRENIKRINEIVRNILSCSKNYVVYGNWSCPHWPISCNNEYEWQCKYSLESLRRYLTLNQKDRKEFFMSKCKECDKKSLIMSFFLYNQQPNVASKEPNVEIVCRLEWNNHYRVFAEWKCNRPQRPQHEWKSSYTWISLRNYIEKSSLKTGDYYVQKCHECREECKACQNKPKEKRGCEKCDHDTVILSHSQLVQSPGGKPHKRWLCAKCKGGSICRSDNNYRVPRKRNIELFSIRSIPI